MTLLAYAAGQKFADTNFTMIDWNEIETVLLDMDGTLLDLHFDDYFWQVQLPQKWGEKNDLDIDAARARLLPIFQDTEASLSWYCLDFWSEKLDMDVFALATGIEHLIQVRPHVMEFLAHLDELGKKIVMVTNSHDKFIRLKMQKTQIGQHFHHVFNSHSFGLPKEDSGFWKILAEHLEFETSSTLLIDDNIAVLRSARAHGIEYLLGVDRPSSQAPVRDTGEFQALSCFRDLCCG